MAVEVREIEPVCSSRILDEWSPIDFKDAFAVQIDRQSGLSVRDYVVTLFEDMPGWITLSIRARNAMVSLFGLKTGDDPLKSLGEYKGEVGQCITVFETWESEPGKIVMGCCDKHLDFLCCFTLENHGSGEVFSFETHVKLKGWFGRSYFFFVDRFHPWVVRSMLKQTGRTALRKAC